MTVPKKTQIGGRYLLEAMSRMGMAEVLEAKMQWGGR
jgi:hypothetical protein